MDIRKLSKIQKKNEKELLKRANVVSIGQGFKVVEGKVTDEICIIIGVTKKIDKSQIQKRDVIPETIDGMPTDVVEIGFVVAQAKKKKKISATAESIDPTHKFRPAMPGVSIGHKNITSGTLGCVVLKHGTRMILSNNHVLSNTNDAEIGDDIYQPGPYDGGTSLDRIGELSEFVPIDFGGGGGVGGGGGSPTCPFARATAKAANIVAAAIKSSHRLAAIVPFAGTNYVDAALAIPTDEITDEIIQIGKPQGIAQATLRTPVQKYGRTTKYTTGEITQVNATINVSYGAGKSATFYEQLITGPMSAGGDSGSVVLDMNNNIVGLLFAGSDSVTILNPISKVFELLGVTL